MLGKCRLFTYESICHVNYILAGLHVCDCQTSLIFLTCYMQELQLLIDEANQPLEDSVGTMAMPVHDVVVVVLHREGTTGSVGITLAGGADYEAKEITVQYFS
jgi:hypothetical protein